MRIVADYPSHHDRFRPGCEHAEFAPSMKHGLVRSYQDRGSVQELWGQTAGSSFVRHCGQADFLCFIGRLTNGLVIRA